ncbi:kinetochore complex Sim4 subunit Fta1-domain-containing protein [Truncatella angustata]|uniref:Kinetochore complex Sim4 subunit Fta1-domain-containing protein n=1 Tax=Truncatella angustata TaxID=152316 RepID=A0A9P8UZ34_9PEZI|nr:kinetochore complex Sim4 subunit Fta1-domain-containing protein [Truncatella angustata]KAH6661018.1 kinetochore complex Sim4 subunit Fta1-domain-containing protein [Truncatella angustata]KAH8203727.1 hypothetical protein TruAng_002140 [Truncatella angustata]
MDINKTFTVHCMRVASSVTAPDPSILSQRLRDYLAGDTVRGVEVSVDESTVGDSGTLNAIDWQVDEEDAEDIRHRVELAYEKSTFLVFVLLSRSLLLLYAPAPIRNAVVRFLAQTFDTRISPLIPNPATLISVFETWLGDGGLSTKKDVIIALGFGDKIPGEGLRSIDIAIPAEDVGGFVGEGENFSDNLAAYMDKHLALNMKHAGVRIVKIACGGFVLGGGKMKLLDEAASAVVLNGISLEHI